MIINTKLPDTGTSIFAIMSGLADEVGAINLSQGFPDFDPDPELVELVHQAMVDGKNQYAPMPGVPGLRRQLAEKIDSLYNVRFDPDTEITITAGATQGIYTCLSALVSHGDEVIVIEPAYDSYVPTIKLNGGVPVYVQLKGPDFSVDWDEVRSKITSRTRVFIMNTPHNPTGTVWTDRDWKMLEELAVTFDLIVISDEVYEHLVFDGHSHTSVMSYPELMSRSVACFSFGKVFHNTGWKMGYCVAPPSLTDEIRKVHQFLVFSCNTPTQHALATYLQDPLKYLELNTFFERKRNVLVNALESSGFKFKPASGTYFQLLNYEKLSDLSDYDFCVRLAKEFGVAAIPISAFYHDNFDGKYIRLCFAKSESMLEEAARRISVIK